MDIGISRYNISVFFVCIMLPKSQKEIGDEDRGQSTERQTQSYCPPNEYIHSNNASEYGCVYCLKHTDEETQPEQKLYILRCSIR